MCEANPIDHRAGGHGRSIINNRTIKKRRFIMKKETAGKKTAKKLNRRISSRLFHSGTGLTFDRPRG